MSINDSHRPLRRPSPRAESVLLLLGLAVLLFFVLLVLLIELPLPPEGLRFLAKREKIGVDAFWSALYAGAIAGLITGIATGLITGLFVRSIEERIQNRREQWEIERSINTAAYRVLERLESIAAPCARLLEMKTAGDSGPSSRQGIADNLKLTNDEKWWLGGDLDQYRDAINPHKGETEIHSLPGHERLQRRIRQQILLQPEIRLDSLPEFKGKVDALRSELRTLLREPESVPVDHAAEPRSIGRPPSGAPVGPQPPGPGVFDQPGRNPRQVALGLLRPFVAGLAGGALGLLLLRFSLNRGSRRRF